VAFFSFWWPRISASTRFWPIAEPAQADYERLREIVLTGDDVGELLWLSSFRSPDCASFADRMMTPEGPWHRQDLRFLCVGALRPDLQFGSLGH
jgi:hypothetical protein